MKLNLKPQFYKGIEFRLIKRCYRDTRAKRYCLNNTNQNVWIPNKHLLDDGTLLADENIDYIFRQAKRQLEIAGYSGPIPGIKKTSPPKEVQHAEI